MLTAFNNRRCIAFGMVEADLTKALAACTGGLRYGRSMERPLRDLGTWGLL